MLGLVAVALGGIGIVVPGLPTTVFFIIAAWAFSKSSPRLEAWVLNLPTIGPLVQDYRDGLGMPRRAKVIAITMVSLAVATSTYLIASWPVRWTVLAAGLVGVGVILWWVPTREKVLDQRAQQAT